MKSKRCNYIRAYFISEHSSREIMTQNSTRHVCIKLKSYMHKHTHTATKIVPCRIIINMYHILYRIRIIFTFYIYIYIYHCLSFYLFYMLTLDKSFVILFVTSSICIAALLFSFLFCFFILLINMTADSKVAK